MIEKDLDSAMSQFSNDVPWINSQGYYFQGKNEVLNFHNMLAQNDSLDYYYKAGIPRIRMIEFENAVGNICLIFFNQFEYYNIIQ